MKVGKGRRWSSYASEPQYPYVGHCLNLFLSKCKLLDQLTGDGIITSMGLITESIDRLPKWARIALMLVGLGAIVYGIATEGWTFLLKAIFSPEI